MLDPRFVDVRKPSGCRLRETVCGEEWPKFADTDLEVIPRSEWKDLLAENTSLETVVKKIKNQQQEGSCASNATCQAYEIVWNMMMGLPYWIEMSPISIYRHVADGPNSGSVIDHNLRQLRDVGCLPSSENEGNVALLQKLKLNPQHRLKNVGYYQRFPQNWQETAQHFRALEWFEIESFEELITCLFLDFPVVYGRSGHAICGVTPVLDKNIWHVKYANSWGQWGDNGFGYDTERFISGSIPSYGAWGLRAVMWPLAITV
jgi:hypothetical protein